MSEPLTGSVPSRGTSSDAASGSRSVDVFAFPMSFAQRRLWFLEQLEPGTAAFNIPFALRFQGKLDDDALDKALSEIIRRHEVLRANFRTANGLPVQIIHAPDGIQIPLVDLSHVSLGEQETRVSELANQEAQRPFNLATDEMVRATLLRLQDEVHVLLLTTHHIVFDGWSRAILIRELATLYESFGAGQSSPLPELKIQYTDYAVWQQRYLEGDNLDKLVRYWKKQLAGAPASLELPTDCPRPALSTFKGASLVTPFTRSLVDKLNRVSRQEAVTPFMGLLAVFQILLSRYSGEEDVVVGVPIANRNRTEIENLIGFFVNTLVMRTELSGNPSFRELLGRVREVALGAYDHQNLPFEKLVEELQPQRNLSQNPLFQVMFSLRNVPTRAFGLPGLQVELLPTANESAKLDLALFLSQADDNIEGRWEYRTDLFDRATIDRMAAQYFVALEAALADPSIKLSDIPLLSRAEKQQLLFTWNQTGRELPPSSASLVHLFEEQVSKHPEKLAFYCGQQSISYEELNQKANQIAHFLLSQSVRKATIAGLCMERSLAMVAALLGALKAGCVYLPLDPTFPRERLAYMVENSKAQVVITAGEERAFLAQCGTTVLDLEVCREQIEAQPSHNPGRVDSTTDLAYVIYTSGSTGAPKGVACTHQQILNRFTWMWEAYPFMPQEVSCQKTALSFVDSIWELLGPLLKGCASAIIPDSVLRDPSLLVRELAEKRVTRIWLVPSWLESLLESFPDLGSRLPHLKFWVSTGEPLPITLLQRFQQAVPKASLFNLYGTSEVWDATWYDASEQPAVLPRVPIGKPIQNVRVYVLDQHQNPVPIGVPGELYIAGQGLAEGYLHQPELTAQKWLKLPRLEHESILYRSGDRVRFLADGNLEYLGRFDNQIKLHGFRIEVEEIEILLDKFPGVQKSVVTLHEDAKGTKRLIAYVVPKAGESPTSFPLRNYLRDKLPEYMVPSRLVLLDVLPLTPSGKVDRRHLPDPDVRREDLPRVVAPRNPTETMLVKIWERTLGLEPVGITDDFFELGGHSFLAIRLIAEIQKITGKQIPVSALFRGATVEYLAGIMNQGPEELSYPLVMEICDESLSSRANPSKPPFFCVSAPGDNALGYIALKRHMDPEQPVYKLQAPRPGGTAEAYGGYPYSQAEWKSMAEEYLDAMRFVQAKGPYFLGGMCGGARIAFEMACRLEAEGEKVGLLAIFDTWVMENTMRPLLWSIDWYRYRTRQLLQMNAVDRRETVKRVLARWMKRGASGGDNLQPKLWRQAYWPDSTFTPSVYAGPLTLFKVSKQPFYRIRDPRLGWGNRTTGDVELHEISAPVHSMVLREPYVKQVAKMLSEGIRRAPTSPCVVQRRVEQSLGVA